MFENHDKRFKSELILNFHVFITTLIIIKIKMFFSCSSSKESKSFFQLKKLEMLNNIKDSLERKMASINASIEVLEKQIERDKSN